eukprot:6322156-Lingulodinium_polyedra.AAC.1
MFLPTGVWAPNERSTGYELEDLVPPCSVVPENNLTGTNVLGETRPKPPKNQRRPLAAAPRHPPRRQTTRRATCTKRAPWKRGPGQSPLR